MKAWMRMGLGLVFGLVSLSAAAEAALQLGQGGG